MQFLGFTPTEIAKNREALFLMRKMDRASNVFKQRINARIENAYIKIIMGGKNRNGSLINEGQAGCGGCGPSSSLKVEKKGLLESVPRNNFIEGNVLISCGMCNFMNGDKDCALAIKVGTKVFSVNDVGIDDH